MEYKIDKSFGRDSSDYGNDDGNRNTKRSKFINFIVNNRLGNIEQITTMLEIIYINFNNMKDEIDEFVGRDPSNYGNANSKGSIRRLKFVKFFINDRSDYFEQFMTIIEMI